MSLWQPLVTSTPHFHRGAARSSSHPACPSCEVMSTCPAGGPCTKRISVSSGMAWQCKQRTWFKVTISSPGLRSSLGPKVSGWDKRIQKEHIEEGLRNLDLLNEPGRETSSIPGPRGFSRKMKTRILKTRATIGIWTLQNPSQTAPKRRDLESKGGSK